MLDDLKGQLIIGIDLGTTKSGVAVWDAAAGKPVMLRDENGDDIIPSVVAWDRDANDWVVGKPAKAILEQRPWDVAYSVKRFIGRSFSDRAVGSNRDNVTYGMTGGTGEDLRRDVIVRFGQEGAVHHELDIPQISAKVLARLRATAARALNRPLQDIKHAVVTVPAYFDMRQRMATQYAAELAGLEVRTILNEPTAAALSHGDDILSTEERTILVYDLGGGTFDISLLDVSRDEYGYQFFTRLIDGNTQLGGDDIDSAIAQMLAREIGRQTGEIVRPDDPRTRSRLRLAAERAKQALTAESATTVTLEDLDLGSRTPFTVSIDVSREEMEACAAPVVNRAREITERAVTRIADLKWGEIHEVVLVGGQTLMPSIQRDVAQFTGKNPRVSDRPQTAIALGAAVYAHMLSLGRAKFEQHALTNTIALALGVRMTNGAFKKIVHANATVPHRSAEEPVTTVRDDQTEIIVEVLQGREDATRAEDCVSLGTLRMAVPPAVAGQNRYDVRFDVDSNGIMTATVTDPQRRLSESLTIGDRTLSVFREVRAPTTV
jgi:molecular chaperone DnaK